MCIRDSRELVEADAGCFEASGPSTGVGFEAGFLAGRKRPVLFLYDSDAAPASAVVLYPVFDNCLSVPYRDLMEIESAVRTFCEAIAPYVEMQAEA